MHNSPPSPPGVHILARGVPRAARVGPWQWLLLGDENAQGDLLVGIYADGPGWSGWIKGTNRVWTVLHGTRGIPFAVDVRVKCGSQPLWCYEGRVMMDRFILWPPGNFRIQSSG